MEVAYWLLKVLKAEALQVSDFLVLSAHGRSGYSALVKTS